MTGAKRPTCDTCPYWERIILGLGDEGSNDQGFGYCIRYAPRPTTVPRHRIEDTNAVAVWPKTDGGEGCGEHPDFPLYLKVMLGSE